MPSSSSPERIYRASVRAFSILFILLGVAILVITLVRAGVTLTLGILMGPAFIAIGCGRLWLASRMPR